MDTLESCKFPVVITGHGAHHSHGNGHGHSFSHVDILADIRKDIGNCESSIKDAVQRLTLSQSLEFRHVFDKTAEIKEETIHQGLEGRLKTEESKGFIAKEMSDKMCGIEKDLREMRQAAIQDRLNDAEAEVAAMKTTNSTQTILSAIAGLPVVASAALKQ